MKTLRVILWDQLSTNISSLRDADVTNDLVLFIETRSECVQPKHHKKKLLFLLSAMRHFAQELKDKGFKVHYVALNDADNTQNLDSDIVRIAKANKVNQVVVTCPGEYRIYAMLNQIKQDHNINIQILDDDRFLISTAEFNQWAKNKKSLRMEFFYREMRKKHHVLMHDNTPEGGKWNYDSDNREFHEADIAIPAPSTFAPDNITQEVADLINREFQDHFGATESFHYAVTRRQALMVLKQFIKERLPRFGEYQDVMLQNQPWLFHSHISHYLNAGLLLPMECIKAAEDAFYRGDAAISAAEGFIRQILGWREFVRGIYWFKMPSYQSENYFLSKRRLPHFYWTADTDMNCIKQCVNDTKANAYAHHIQRLMVLGNFALLAGLDPADVNEWYVIVYADAHEWVELPNVTGMILFADGGYLASKPYVASGAYINKMSNYCENCTYNVKEKNGKQACPFNYLYWNFLLNHRDKLKNNLRLSMIYAALSRMNQEKISAIQADAATFLATLRHDW